MREFTHVAALGVWLVPLRSGADANQKPANARPKTRYVTTTYRTAASRQHISTTSVCTPVSCVQTTWLSYTLYLFIPSANLPRCDGVCVPGTSERSDSNSVDRLKKSPAPQLLLYLYTNNGNTTTLPEACGDSACSISVYRARALLHRGRQIRAQASCQAAGGQDVIGAVAARCAAHPRRRDAAECRAELFGYKRREHDMGLQCEVDTGTRVDGDGGEFPSSVPYVKLGKNTPRRNTTTG
jgi:hypothetical protein